MAFFSLINRIPLFLLFGLTLAYVFLAIGAGMRLGELARKGSTDQESIGSVVGASLALVAFMLAFTFNMAANRFDVRKQLLLEEMNSIGTTYLRTGLLPHPYREVTRELLREYVDLRVRVSRQEIALTEAIVLAESVQQKLWTVVTTMVDGETASLSQVMFIESLNEMIDLQTQRETVGLQYRIPDTIWVALYAVTGLGMLILGYQFGRPHMRNIQVNVLLAIAFSFVIMLIADLDRAEEGTVRLNNQPLYELQQRLQVSSSLLLSPSYL